MTNLYDTLGVPKSAPQSEIKKAYRKKAKQAHPDSGGSKEEFNQLSKAYKVLSDQTSRDRYDQTGNAEPQPDTVTAEALSLLAQLVIQAADQDNLTINPFKSMLQLIEGERLKLTMKIKLHENRKVKLEKWLLRVSRKKKIKTPDFVKQIIETQQQQEVNNALGAKRAMEILDKAEELLNGYEFEVDKPKPQPTVGLGGFNPFFSSAGF